MKRHFGIAMFGAIPVVLMGIAIHVGAQGQDLRPATDDEIRRSAPAKRAPVSVEKLHLALAAAVKRIDRLEERTIFLHQRIKDLERGPELEEAK